MAEVSDKSKLDEKVVVNGAQPKESPEITAFGFMYTTIPFGFNNVSAQFPAFTISLGEYVPGTL